MSINSAQGDPYAQAIETQPPTIEELRKSPKIPKDGWRAIANAWFDQFDKNQNNKLEPTELAEFRDYLDDIFDNNQSKKLKPPFNTVVRFDDDGSLNRKLFKDWFEDHMTYEESQDPIEVESLHRQSEGVISFEAIKAKNNPNDQSSILQNGKFIRS